MDRRTFLTATRAAPFVDASKALAQTPSKTPALAWTQWGGPNRNFHTDARGLKDTWPATGPRVVWKRPLGEGYSSPCGRERRALRDVRQAARGSGDGGRRGNRQDAVGTRDADDVSKRCAREMGNGPYSTPLIAGNRVFTTGVAGRLQCLDKKTGKLLWTQQLWDDHGGSQMMYGYASQPDRVSESRHRPGRRPR